MENIKPTESLEQRRQAIKEELKESAGLNNFPHYFGRRNNPRGGLRRGNTEHLKDWDKFPADDYSSDLKHQQTYTEFYATLDNVMNQVLSKKQVEELYDLLDLIGKRGQLTDQKIKRTEELLEPIYIELRLMGYNWDDLAR